MAIVITRNDLHDAVNFGSAGEKHSLKGIWEFVSANAIYLVTIWAIPVIVAITFHEAAHGFVARLLGDDTAYRLGRVSFNPAKHIDPLGTILLPGMLLLLRARFPLATPSRYRSIFVLCTGPGGTWC